jgi:hypothetical protein
MRKLLTAAALALLFPLAASAQISVGAKLGLSIPWGEALDGGDMQDGSDFIVPIEINGMYEVAPNMGVGAYLSYGFVNQDNDVVDGCDDLDWDCSAHQWRLGIKGEMKLDQIKIEGFKPYVGANLGLEWGVTKRSGTMDIGLGDMDFESKTSLRGWELGFEAGADMPMSTPGLTVGAFVNLSFARYGTVSWDSELDGDSDSDSDSIDSDDKAMHGFFQLGVRGTFDVAMQ